MDAPTQHVHNRNIGTLAHVQGEGHRPVNNWLEQPCNERMDIADAKKRVDLAELVAETHTLTSASKVLCPVHDDHSPSCHIYNDHWRCFACGAGGDIIDWLELAHGLGKAEAVAELRRRAGSTTTAPPAKHTVAEPKVKAKKTQLKPISGDVLTAHLARAETLVRGPQALSGRGFSLSDLQQLGVAADGNDAIIPITGPTSDVMALKRRYAARRGKMRYIYDTPGHGTPAWCSLEFAQCTEILIIEGELNGMASWLARRDLGVMGIAGTTGDVYAEALENKIVYVYADNDEVGLAARRRWARAAVKAGAEKVYVIEPWEIDACDIAGRLGRAELARRLA